MKNVFLLMLVLAVILASCKKKPDIIDECPIGLPDNGTLPFKIVDKFNIDLIASYGHRYISDSIKIFDIDNKPLDIKLWTIRGNGSIRIRYLDINPSYKFNQLFTKQYIIRYPAISASIPVDLDTIRLDYEIYEFNNHSSPCYLLDFRKYDVYYNGILHHSGTPRDEILLKKLR